MKIKNKLMMIAFTLVAFLSFGVVNVEAMSVKSVTTADDLQKAFNDNEAYKIKLGAKIDDADELYFYINEDHILDLNGFTLELDKVNTLPNLTLVFMRENATLKIIDSTNSKNGTIIGGISAKSNETNFSSKNYTLDIDGIKIKSLENGSQSNVIYLNLGDDYYWKNTDQFHLKIDNTSLEHFGTNSRRAAIFIDNQEGLEENVDLSFGNLTYTNFDSVSWGLLDGNKIKNYKVSDIINEFYELEYSKYISGNSPRVYEKTIANRNDLVKNLPDGTGLSSGTLYTDAGHNTMIIKEKTGFNVIAPIFGEEIYGYSDAMELPISIKAVGGNRTIDYVDIDNHEEFIFVGIDDPADKFVADGTTNTLATIKPKDGLNYGEHTATILVVDTENNEYRTTVSFEVVPPAGTVLINDKDDYLYYRDRINEETTLKLTDSFSLAGVDGPGNKDAIDVRADLTIDLNGETLTLNWNAVKLWYYGPYTVKIIDTSSSGTGKIIAEGSRSGINVSYISLSSSVEGTGKLIIDGIDIERTDNYEGDLTIWRNDDANKKFDVLVKNTNFKSWLYSISLQGPSDKNNLTLKIEPTTTFDTYNNYNMIGIARENLIHYSDVIDVTKAKVVGKPGSISADEEEITTSDVLNDTIKYYGIRVIPKDGFEVTAPTFDSVAYGYGAVTAKPITIATVGPDRQVKSVVANDPSKFTVEGTGTPTIVAGTPDTTTFTIKPVTGLEVGTHTTTITVKDMSDNIYTGMVTFVVGKANFTPTVSISDWVYGEYNAEVNGPTIGLNISGGSEYFRYIGISTLHDSDEVPTNAGTYKVIATVEETENYNSATVEKTFEITKKIVTVDENKMRLNDKEFDTITGTTETVDSDAINIPSVLNDYRNVTTTDHDTSSQEMVGNYKGTITFTINANYTDNYQFSNGTSTYTTGKYDYKITSAPTTINDISSGNAEVVKTNSVDLKNLVSINYALKESREGTLHLIDELTFALDGSYDGVTLTGSTLSASNDASVGVVKIKVNFDGHNWNIDDGDLEFAAASEIAIYVKVVNKPSQVFTGDTTDKTVQYGDTLNNSFSLSTGNGAITYSSADTTIATVDANTGVVTGVKAGSTTITVTAAETSDYAAASITYNLTVSKRALTVKAGTYTVTKEYNGSVDAVNGTGDFNTDDGRVNGDTIALKAYPNDFEQSDCYNGEGTVLLELTGDASLNYYITNAGSKIVVPYSITQKLISLDITYTGSCTYTGSSCTVDFTVKRQDNSVVLPTGSYDISYDNNVDAGTVTATFTPKATSNYTWTSATKTYTIEKADYPGTAPTISKNVIQNTADTYYVDFSEISVAGGLENVQFVSASAEGELVTSAEVDNANSRIKYVVASKAAGTTGKVKVTIASKNHKNVTATINVTAVNKTVITIDGITFSDKTYDGVRISYEGELTASHSYNAASLICKYTGSNGYNDEEPPFQAGTYTYTCSVQDSDPTYTGTQSWTFTINKNIPTGYTVPNNLVAIVGDSLYDITFSDTRFSWVSANTTLTAGDNTFEVKFTPEDAINYEVVTGINVSVYVKNKFNVTNTVEGGNGTISGNLENVVEGTEKEITFTPNAGYMIDKVFVNDVDKTSTVSSNKIKVTVNSETTVKVSYKKIPFTLTINEVNGATINPTGVLSISYGDTKVIEIAANHGYRLLSIKVNGTEKISELSSDGKLTLNNITEDTNVVVEVEKIVYELIEGDNLKTKDLTKLRFRFNADYSKFEIGGKVYIDNTLVDSANYTSEEGSTIITLTEDYAKTLSKGNHQIKVVFNDGGEATGNFIIVDPTANPQTGDNILVSIVMAIISGLGLATVAIFGKKKLKLQK